MSKDFLKDLIDDILKLDSVWYANYYASSMKKQPHGGVAHVFWPNYYIRYFHKQLMNLFINNPNEAAFFMEQALNDVMVLVEKHMIDIDIVLRYFCDSDSFWYVGFRILEPKEKFKNFEYPLIWEVIEKNLSFKDYFEIDDRKVYYAFLCYLLDCNKLKIDGLSDIEEHETLLYQHNKYGLTDITGAEFRRQGFIYDNKYFLYSIFFDTTIGEPLADVPITIKLLHAEIYNPKLDMRLDNNLAVPIDKMVCTATTDSEVFRGITLSFADIERIIYGKEVIVHYCPETMHKIIMIVKKDDDNGTPFYHIEIEELWNPESINDDFVIINFIHAKYYPRTKSFNHIDFSVNQYQKDTYTAKYEDAPNYTGVPIDKYCDTHYKVWCVETDTISIETWSKLVSATLDEPFRELFYEMFDTGMDLES